MERVCDVEVERECVGLKYVKVERVCDVEMESVMSKWRESVCDVEAESDVKMESLGVCIKIPS